MIKYKYLRFLAATGWGCVAMVMVLCGLWIFTELEIQNIIFLMIMAYLVVMGVILWFTEMPSESGRQKTSKTKKKPLHKAKVQQMPVKNKMPIYTYNKGDGTWTRS